MLFKIDNISPNSINHSCQTLLRYTKRRRVKLQTINHDGKTECKTSEDEEADRGGGSARETISIITKHQQQKEKPHAGGHESIFIFTALQCCKNLPTPTTTKLNAFYQEPVDPHKLEHNSDVIIKWRITFHYFSLIKIQKIWHASNVILCRSNVLFLASFISQSTNFPVESYCHSMMLPPPCISAQMKWGVCVFTH